MSGQSTRRPYHELEQAVARMESELSAFAPMAQAMLRMERRAAEAEERAWALARGNRELERRLTAAQADLDDAWAKLDTPTEAERAAYRRGYGAGHTAGRQGREANPDRAMRDKRNRLRVA